MTLRLATVTTAIAIFVAASTAAFAAADSAPTAKPEATETSQKAEGPGKTAASKKTPKTHSHTQEKSGGSPSTVAAADTTKKTPKAKPHQHSRDAK